MSDNERSPVERREPVEDRRRSKTPPTRSDSPPKAQPEGERQDSHGRNEDARLHIGNMSYDVCIFATDTGNGALLFWETRSGEEGG